MCFIVAKVCKVLDLEDPIAKRQKTRFQRRITSVYTGPSLKNNNSIRNSVKNRINSVGYVTNYNNYGNKIGEKLNLEPLESIATEESSSKF